jgi:hypothetical protein
LFLKDTLKKQANDDVTLVTNESNMEITINQLISEESSSFQTALRQFLKKVEQDPIDIDTRIFDADREKESGRDFQL